MSPVNRQQTIRVTAKRKRQELNGEDVDSHLHQSLSQLSISPRKTKKQATTTTEDESMHIDQQASKQSSKR